MCTATPHEGQECFQANTVKFGAHLEIAGLTQEFSRDEEIFGEGESADYVYKVISGAARTVHFTCDGRRQILGFHMPGDTFGLEAGNVHAFSAEALTDSRIVMVRRSALYKAASEDPESGRTLVALLVESLRRANDHAMMLTHRAAPERVATFLLRLADRADSAEALDLPMSRADIGDYLGLTIETVSRTFSEMRRKRAIALPTARRIVMKNPAALAQLEAA